MLDGVIIVLSLIVVSDKIAQYVVDAVRCKVIITAHMVTFNCQAFIAINYSSLEENFCKVKFNFMIEHV
jgi:hypothetical protein